jgi:poly-gamma-glutamate synthesis protein (capsule biosynthesis protein)
MVSLQFDCNMKRFKSLELIPYKQSVGLGGVEVIKGVEREIFLQNVDSYKEKLENNDSWLAEWNKLVNRQTDNYILRQFMPVIFRGVGLLTRNTPISKFLFNKKNSLSKLNLLRCQSHRELLISALESKSQKRND